jgi:L-lactate utilization protein LutB
MEKKIFGSTQYLQTFCDRCESICPVKIPLPDLLHEFHLNVHHAGPAEEAGGQFVGREG